MQAECPECAATISVDGAVKGEIISCAECGMELELVQLDPPLLQPAPREEEDWGE